MAINNPVDALGIASRDKAERRRWAQFGESGNMRALDGNAMDPQWDAFLERLNGRKVVQGPSFNTPYQPTFNPMQGQGSAVVTAAPQIDRTGQTSGVRVQSRTKPTMANPSSIDGIMRVTRGR